MADAARAAETPIRRDAVLEAVASAAERLLRSADWRDTVEEVLARLGEAAAVSRASLTQNSVDRQGRLCSTLVAEWCAPGIPSQKGNPDLQESSWEEGFARWISFMERGASIIGPVRGLPVSEAEMLRAQGIVSLAYFPVAAEGSWWGCVGFEDCEMDRDWSSEDLDGLRTAAALLGAAIGRQLQEERVRLAEARYRSVVERIPAVTYVDVVEETVVRMGFVSPQIEALLGYPYERFLEDPDFWFELVHPDDQERVDAAARRSGYDGAPFDEEYRMRHADGGWVWVHDTSVPVTDDTGRVSHFQGFLLDVTMRRETAKALAEAESRYRGVVENIPAVTYIDQPTGAKTGAGAKITFVSPQIEAVLGYPSESFTQDPGFWFSIMHPDDLARLDGAGAFDVNSVEPFAEEYRMRHADGRWIWVHDTSTAVYDEQGDLRFFQGFLMDVSTRHEAEEGMRRAEERFRVLVEQMPAIVYTEGVEPGTHRATLAEYVSPQVESVLGYTASSWLEDVNFWQRIVHPEDRERAEAAFEHVNQTGEPLKTDYRVLRADGSVAWIHEEAVYIPPHGEEPAYWQGFMLDVTTAREAEEKIRIAEERYRTIVEHTPVISYQESPVRAPYSEDSTMSYVSPQIEAILGYRPDEWETPGFWARVMHPDDLPAVLAESNRTNETGEPYRQDYRMYAADGRLMWFHDESHLIRDASGEPVVWQGVMVDITERKEAEQQLRHAQDRLQALIDHMPAAVYIESPDADPHKFYLSPQVEQLFGYTADEWTWTPDFWLDHIHRDNREEVERLDQRTDGDHAAFATEYRFRRADGEYVWVHDEAVFVPTEDGAGFWQGFLFDITPRKQAEDQLAEAERVLRATIEHLPALVYREPPSPDLGRLYISPQAERLFGYTPEEWTGTPGFWRAHIHPDDRQAVLQANELANQTKEQYSVDYRFMRSDGEYVWVHDEASFVSEVGREEFWQGFIVDITERKEAEQQLREAEEKFRTIVENNPAIIYTQEFDPENPSVSKTTYISPRQPEVFGYEVEDVIADPTLWTRLIHPEDRDRVLAADVKSNSGEADRFSLEYRMIAKDGRIIWVQDDAQLVQIDGRTPFWQGFLLDITERKKAEDQLARALEVERDAAQRLRALDEMKNTFLQAVSHDLRTPLAAILGLAITLGRGDMRLPEEDARDLALRIAENAKRLDRLVTNLLDLDRLARGIATPKLEPTDIATIVEHVLTESELIPTSRLHARLEPVVIPADASKIERIVENLLANTVRHTPSDSSIWVSVLPDPAGALLMVEDDGPGVAEDLREEIFEPFRQGPDAPRHSPGVGVGLALVRRFAELHGGTAWVEDREGGGASFRVLLPSEPPAKDD
jgi:PAS domain S-box-containing protein